MKVEVCEYQKKAFEPITLTITIESEDDLCVLENSYGLWSKIDKLCIARGLRK